MKRWSRENDIIVVQIQRLCILEKEYTSINYKEYRHLKYLRISPNIMSYEMQWLMQYRN